MRAAMTPEEEDLAHVRQEGGFTMVPQSVLLFFFLGTLVVAAFHLFCLHFVPLPLSDDIIVEFYQDVQIALVGQEAMRPNLPAVRLRPDHFFPLAPRRDVAQKRIHGDRTLSTSTTVGSTVGDFVFSNP